MKILNALFEVCFFTCSFFRTLAFLRIYGRALIKVMLIFNPNSIGKKKKQYCQFLAFKLHGLSFLKFIILGKKKSINQSLKLLSSYCSGVSSFGAFPTASQASSTFCILSP